jgi:maltose-binding protein MalE
MNTSIARAGRRTTRTLSVAAAAVATVSLLAACASAEGGTSAGSASDDTTTASAEAKEVQVIDQTNLLLATAQETLEARGLEVQVADASGQGRAIDDPTQWVVVTQDPTSGSVERGTEVTLTVRMTTDPVG